MLAETIGERSPFQKKLRLVSAYVKKKPVWLSWQVTYWCNYHCDFCDYRSVCRKSHRPTWVRAEEANEEGREEEDA